MKTDQGVSGRPLFLLTPPVGRIFRASTRPAILGEPLLLSHPLEAQLLRHSGFPGRLEAAYAAGILD